MDTLDLPSQPLQMAQSHFHKTLALCRIADHLGEVVEHPGHFGDFSRVKTREFFGQFYQGLLVLPHFVHPQFQFFLNSSHFVLQLLLPLLELGLLLFCLLEICLELLLSHGCCLCSTFMLLLHFQILCCNRICTWVIDLPRLKGETKNGDLLRLNLLCRLCPCLCGFLRKLLGHLLSLRNTFLTPLDLVV